MAVPKVLVYVSSGDQRLVISRHAVGDRRIFSRGVAYANLLFHRHYCVVFYRPRVGRTFVAVVTVGLRVQDRIWLVFRAFRWFCKSVDVYGCFCVVAVSLRWVVIRRAWQVDRVRGISMRTAVSAYPIFVVLFPYQGDLRHVSSRSPSGSQVWEVTLVVDRRSVYPDLRGALLRVLFTLRHMALMIHTFRRTILVHVPRAVVMNKVFASSLREGHVILRRYQAGRRILPIVVQF